MALDNPPPAASKPQLGKPRQWTVAAYIVADDVDESDPARAANIDAAASKEIAAMREALRGLDAHVAIQVDYKGRPGVHRWIDDYEETLPERASGDRLELHEFLAAVADRCESQFRLVLFWGHGAGPIGMFNDDTPDSAKKTLSLPDIRDGLAILGHVDIFVVKSCSMATLEAAFELQQVVDFLVASQGNVSEQPWTYGHIVNALRSATGSNMESVATAIVEALHRHYMDPALTTDDEVPLALMRLAEIPAIAGKVRALFEVLAASKRLGAADGLRQKAFEDARPDPPPWEPTLIDLATLCEHLLLVPSCRDEARDLLAALEPRFVLRRRPQDSLYRGVSVFHYPPDGSGDFAGEIRPVDYVELKLCTTVPAWPPIALEYDPRAAFLGMTLPQG
jgi:hypothetical protein